MVMQQEIIFSVNGQVHTVHVHPMKRLLDTIREDIGLKGTKEGCGEGECGACTVLLDGLPVASCMIPTCQVHGRHITTIEGVAKIKTQDCSTTPTHGEQKIPDSQNNSPTHGEQKIPDSQNDSPTHGEQTFSEDEQKTSDQEAELHPIQESFLKHGGTQCGICTPGMILSALAYQNNPAIADNWKQALSGNLCRCTGYTKIVESCLNANNLGKIE